LTGVDADKPTSGTSNTDWIAKASDEELVEFARRAGLPTPEEFALNV
jgi:hypothetical protein